MIDRQNLHRALRRYKLQPHLPLKGCENVWQIGIGRRSGTARVARSSEARQPSRRFVCCETQIEIEFARKACLIENGPPSTSANCLTNSGIRTFRASNRKSADRPLKGPDT